MVKNTAHRIRQLSQVFITAITGTRQNHNATSIHVNALGQVRHHAHGMRVMTVVHDDLEGQFAENVQTARCLEEARVKRAQALADRIELDAHRIGDCGSHHRVLDVMTCLTF